MRRWVRWQDWTIAALGAYMLFVPLFTLDKSNDATIWAAEVLGGLVILGAVWALAAPDMRSTEWTNAVLGALLFVAPWVLDYADLGGAAWNAWVVGALVALTALWAEFPASELHERTHAHA